LEEPDVTPNLFATLAGVLLASAMSFDITYSSYAIPNNYTVTISSDALAKSPSWKDNEENPPLSARKAIKLANAVKKSLVKDWDDYKWVLVTADLTPDGDEKWYWLINCEAHPQVGASSGVPFCLKLVVLMDGTVVEPQVRKAENPDQK
jgi:hypothetical protein